MLEENSRNSKLSTDRLVFGSFIQQFLFESMFHRLNGSFSIGVTVRMGWSRMEGGDIQSSKEAMEISTIEGRAVVRNNRRWQTPHCKHRIQTFGNILSCSMRHRVNIDPLRV